MKPKILCFLLLLTQINGFGQRDTARSKPYRVNLAYELTGSVLLVGASYLGFRALDRHSSFTAADVAGLNPANVNAFDRPVIFNDPANFERGQSQSDLFLNISVISPVLLALDKRIRQDWLELVALYAVSHAANNAMYFRSAFAIRRARPFTYNPDVPIEQRVGEAKSNSFYSGHVSFSATGTFFLAKVLTDYHHIRGWKRIGIYSVASIPPILVGINRMKAGKHFRSDVLTGLVVGAAAGILVPELHRRIKKSRSFSLEPHASLTGQQGLSLKYAF